MFESGLDRPSLIIAFEIPSPSHVDRLEWIRIVEFHAAPVFIEDILQWVHIGNDKAASESKQAKSLGKNAGFILNKSDSANRECQVESLSLQGGNRADIGNDKIGFDSALAGKGTSFVDLSLGEIDRRNMGAQASQGDRVLADPATHIKYAQPGDIA